MEHKSMYLVKIINVQNFSFDEEEKILNEALIELQKNEANILNVTPRMNSIIIHYCTSEK
jgi:hypothetical protein